MTRLLLLTTLLSYAMVAQAQIKQLTLSCPPIEGDDCESEPAFKWIGIAFRCWKTRTPYDETRYLEALKKRGSPLLKFAAEY